jgi:[protein-PII] uridylyltransferase
MARIARAGRAIAWPSDEVWRRIHASMQGGRNRQDRPLSDRLVLLDGEVHIRRLAEPVPEPALALEAAAAAATLQTTLDHQSLNHLARAVDLLSEPWPAEARQALSALLLAGRPAISIIETLDQMGIWERFLPEWAAVRCRPQRNAYHRFTVDRHLVEASVGAAALAATVERPDLLVVGALLHDIGKGFPGDHTVVGCELVRTMATRMGFPPADVDDLVAMVEHHLLLPDVASRRDLNDPATITAVAKAVETPQRLHLLAALTEGDSLATGASAWSTWKAGLVEQLVDKVEQVLAGAAAVDVVGSGDRPTLELQPAGEGERVVVDGEQVTVVGPDNPGTFSRVAGVLALHGLDVRAAQAWSEGAVGASRFQVDPHGRTPDWDRVVADIHMALRGRLAIEARLAERAVTYAPRRKVVTVGTSPAASVTVDNGASDTATVIDVQAADAVGLLYRVTRALADLDLDLRTALVQTLGPRVADAFYVTDCAGAKVTDAHHQREIERAIVFACRAR